MKRLPRVSKEDAVRIAGEVAALAEGHELAIRAEGTKELWWAWVVPVNSAEYVRTGGGKHLLFGLGPYLVDKFTGDVIPTGTGTRLHAVERDRGYRPWWKFWGPDSIMRL